MQRASAQVLEMATNDSPCQVNKDPLYEQCVLIDLWLPFFQAGKIVEMSSKQHVYVYIVYFLLNWSKKFHVVNLIEELTPPRP